MTELSENAKLVIDSLETKPALNTPALIAQNEGIDRADAEQGLDELLAIGRVKKRPTGWKLSATRTTQGAARQRATAARQSSRRWT